jgi:hypothetical protein
MNAYQRFALRATPLEQCARDTTLAEHRVLGFGKRWPDLIAASFKTREVRV